MLSSSAGSLLPSPHFPPSSPLPAGWGGHSSGRRHRGAPCPCHSPASSPQCLRLDPPAQLLQRRKPKSFSGLLGEHHSAAGCLQKKKTTTNPTVNPVFVPVTYPSSSTVWGSPEADAAPSTRTGSPGAAGTQHNVLLRLVPRRVKTQVTCPKTCF